MSKFVIIVSKVILRICLNNGGNVYILKISINYVSYRLFK